MNQTICIIIAVIAALYAGWAVTAARSLRRLSRSVAELYRKTELLGRRCDSISRSVRRCGETPPGAAGQDGDARGERDNARLLDGLMNIINYSARDAVKKGGPNEN